MEFRSIFPGHGGRIMVVASSLVSFKIESLVEQARELGEMVQEAAGAGRPLHSVEREVFESVLRIGHAATEMFLQAQGNGDLGPTCTTEAGQTLLRSDESVERPLKTIFGDHTIRAYVYTPGDSHEKIELRPIDVRLQLSDRLTSYLLEEFSQYF